MDNQKENMEITEAIKFFKQGKFGERKPYIEKLFKGNTVEYNGYTFQKELWCWVVWKKTDIGKEPQFKGEPLYKVIPETVPIKNIPAVLDEQPWTYA